MLIDLIREYKGRVEAFEAEAHQILSKHEGAKSRIITADLARQKLTNLSLQQDELFQQSLVCVERGVYRAAHVMAWAAFIDYLEQKLASDGLIKVKAARANWGKFATIEELRENVPETQLIEVARDVGLLGKGETRILIGLLSKRNECAHPSHYTPGLNESLGYIDELLKRIDTLQGKTL